MSNWSSSKFLKLNDESQAQNPGKWDGVCGKKCTRHEFSLTSDVDQTVYLTAFTWGDKGIPEQCEAEDNDLFHALMVSKIDDVMVWNFGDKPVKPFNLKAGETVTIEAEWNFTNIAHAKDWSITAHGDGRKGSLHLTHKGGLKSATWNPILRHDPAHKPMLSSDNPIPVGAKADIDSEAALLAWLNNLKVDSGECSVLKEDSVPMGTKQFMRIGLKSNCKEPVTYGVTMFSEDWTTNMDHVHSGTKQLACGVVDQKEDIIECLFRLTPENPVMGWSMKSQAYGVHAARKVPNQDVS